MNPPRTVFISFSGGADSLTLLLMTLERGEPCRAIHFEHGFRGQESLDDAAFCKRFCKQHHVPIDVIPLNVPQRKRPGEGDEEAARRLRLEAWKKITKDVPGAVVLLGHHADDAAETLLFRLFRGSNASGLAALRRERIVDGIRFERPLLNMTRMDIEAYLKQKRIRKWCMDSTNRESVYLRNFLRNQILPAIAEHAPFAPGGIRRAIQALTLDAEYLEQAADKAFESCRNGNLTAWKTLDPALLPRVLRRFLPNGILPDAALSERIESELKRAPAPNTPEIRIPLPGSPLFLKISRNTLSVEHDVPVLQTAELEWDLKKQPGIIWNDFSFECRFATLKKTRSRQALNDGNAHFDADCLPHLLKITTWHEGDSIRSFDGHRKNLKKLFCDQHISGGKRLQIPILRTPDGEVLFVPGLRAAKCCEIGEQTTRTVTICWKKKTGR